MMKLTIIVAFAMLLSSCSCKKGLLKNLNENILEHFNALDSCYLSYSVGYNPTKDTFTDVIYQVNNITKVDIYYDNFGITGLQVTYGKKQAPLRGRKSQATLKTIDLPNDQYVINKITGTSGYIQDSIVDMQVLFKETGETINNGPFGNPNGGYPYDTSKDDEPRNPAINPDFCRLKYISGSANAPFGEDRRYVKTINWVFYCCQ